MSEPCYTFICEIEHFDIDDYVAHLGWNARNLNFFKIYTRPGSILFYLHDEIQDRMYGFEAADPEKLNSSEALKGVARAFQDQRPDQLKA